MAKSLPLSVNRVDGTAWEESLPYESLPVDLIFVFLRWKLLCHLENFYKLPHRESGALVRSRVVVDFHQGVTLR